MAYKNQLYRMIDEYPVLSFIAVPIGINFAATILAGAIRKNKTGSFFRGVGNVFEEDPAPVSPMAGLGNIRTEGGDASDLMFRATASNRPTGPGGSEYDDVLPRSTGTPVRYDRNYHDTVFFPNLDYKDNEPVISQSYPASVKDTYVFAGINGINKIGMR